MRFDELRTFPVSDPIRLNEALQRFERNVATAFSNMTPFAELWTVRTGTSVVQAKFWDFIRLNTKSSAAAVNLPLPARHDLGKRIILTNDGSNNFVVYAPAPSKLNAAASKTYIAFTGLVEIVCDGAGYWV